jgi:uncharacterized protein
MATWNYNNMIRWIRKSHGWVGLWGAVLGLLFGFSGIWLNHRSVLKLPVTQTRSNAQLALPDPAPANVKDMQDWIQTSLGIAGTANSTKINAAKPVAWADKKSSIDSPLLQPEHWVFNFGGPNQIVQAEYWLGNRSVSVTTTANGFLATLNNMHKGTGMSVPWILLVDTLAGSMIFLSISGVLLWVQTNRKRAVGVVIFSVAASLTLALTLVRL